MTPDDISPNMSDFDQNTWEEFFGSSTELMSSIMGAFDAIIENNKLENPKKSHQANNFTHLSPCVQKILSHVPDQEINKTFYSEENLGKRYANRQYRSLRSPDRTFYKSNENLEISPNVQKMLSNLPDNELVVSAGNLTDKKTNRSFLHSVKNTCDGGGRVSHPDVGSCSNEKAERVGDVCEFVSEVANGCDETEKISDYSENYQPRPLGSYLHTSPQGIASRTPVGRKNMGKYLQVPSETSVGTNSTTSSEVSRPVSLTSLGSCSSSGSSGHNQPGSAYLASAESLDSDNEPSGSADSGIAEQTTINPEQRVLQEVMDTETCYVDDLKQVIEGYLKPWKADPECPLASYLKDLFSNIEEIYEFNRSFLDHLRKADCDPTKTANVFLQNDSGFKVYNEYCANYPRTMDVIGELTRDEKMVPLFREKQLMLGHALPLGSYLLKPVQRILKYHLLLQRLSKQCEPEHKPTVDLALATMTGVASDINNMKRKHEDAVRVQEIQSQLYGWNGPALTALGELIAEGTFRVVGARGRRHVFLFHQVLLMAKSKQDGALAYKAHIMCSNLMLVEQVRGEPLSFQVLPFDNPRLQCTLRARSPQHKREWTLQIKRVILENYSADIPKHAKQLVMQLGQDVPETEDNSEKWSPMKPSTPHYLERRSRVRKTRDFSGRRAASQDRTFPSLGNWRRKSEPTMNNQYTTKTLPHKTTQRKEGFSTFYTDLSDSENCDTIGESTESLNTTTEATFNGETGDRKNEIQKEDLEKIVSDLVMQKQDFSKMFNRPKRVRDSEPTPVIWFEDRAKMPTKADSLPRSFQLNDQLDGAAEKSGSYERHVLDASLKENSDVEVEDQPESDLIPHNGAGDHPEHKIYRKSTIRFSLLQRLRTIMSEEQRKSKYPLYKQGSKNTGEKLAHPDYEDPLKLFTNSRNASRTNLATDCDLVEPERLDMTINEKDVLTEVDKRLHGSKSEPTELHSSHTTFKSSQNSDNCGRNPDSQRQNSDSRRQNPDSRRQNPDSHSQNSDNCRQNSGSCGRNSDGCSQNCSSYSQNSSSYTQNCSSYGQNSSSYSPNSSSYSQRSTSYSPSSDSYYERILDSSLTEEYVKDENGKIVLKQDSFRNSESGIYLTQKYRVRESRSVEITTTEQKKCAGGPKETKRSTIKRPTKAPPPIPVKPVSLASNSFSTKYVAKTETVSQNASVCSKNFLETVESVTTKESKLDNTRNEDPLDNTSKANRIDSMTKENRIDGTTKENRIDGTTKENGIGCMTKENRIDGVTTENRIDVTTKENRLMTNGDVGKSWVKSMVERFE